MVPLSTPFVIIGKFLSFGTLDFTLIKTGGIHVVVSDDGCKCKESQNDLHQVGKRRKVDHYDDLNDDRNCCLKETQHEWSNNVSVV